MEMEKELQKRDPSWFINNPWSKNFKMQQNHLDILNDEAGFEMYLKNKKQIEIEFAAHGYCGKAIDVIESNSQIKV